MNSRSLSCVLAVALVASLALPSLLRAQQSDERKIAVVRFFGAVNSKTVYKLLLIVDGKVKDGADQIVLLISSTGGSVFAGLTAYHYLQGIPAEVVTHNFGVVDSIAAVIYCSGSKRYVVPGGRFTLHGIELNLSGKGQLNQAELQEKLDLIQNETTRMASAISKCSGQPVDKMLRAISERTVLTSQEAIKWGLAHEERRDLYKKGDDVTIVQSETPTNVISRDPIASLSTAITETFTNPTEVHTAPPH